MDERRRHPRYGLRRRVWCEGDRYTITVQSVDASDEGLRVRTAIPPPPGTRLRISFDEPGIGHVAADVEVVWSRAEGGGGAMGLRILGFAEGADRWDCVIAAAAGREHDPGRERVPKPGDRGSEPDGAE